MVRKNNVRNDPNKALEITISGSGIAVVDNVGLVAFVAINDISKERKMEAILYLVFTRYCNINRCLSSK